ncbi:MAG: helix-turn-helix transcriptional regulator [Mesorhizobium sp.]|nr:MAG: helix-turn-helix transcriptional regulator [Mesorhizobium sp.]TIV60302.1 MAG: helix-turn-helix transcriptional regulator [Mesorhizobium sp.]TJV68584.1 MAG: helix-turn-helix transcriptional regulator [Mesorhizobium sp.]
MFSVMTKPDVDWFRRKLEEHRLSQSGLGRMLGIDKSSMSLLLAGKRKLTLTAAADMARILGVTATEVMERFGVRVDGIRGGDDVTPQMLPFEGWIDESSNVHIENTSRRKRMLDVGVNFEAGAGAFQWRTPQSKMDVLDGWIVVSGARREADESMIGRGCVVGLKGGEMMLRLVRRGYAPGTHLLFGLMGTPDVTEAEVEWYAPVLMMKPATT